MATDDGEDDDQSLSDTIRSLRERVQRKQTERDADRRASARRVNMGEPETAGERVEVAKQEASEAAGEASGLASDAVTLISSEFGVSRDDASSIIDRGADLLETAGGTIDNLDADGDGDTDILTALEAESVEATTGEQARSREGGPGAEAEADAARAAPTDADPVDPLGGGVEADLGLDFPLEEQ